MSQKFTDQLLTTLSVKNEELNGAASIRITDSVVSCLSIQSFPNGTKSFRYRYTVEGNRFEETIGRYPEVSIAEARGKAIQIGIEKGHFSKVRVIGDKSQLLDLRDESSCALKPASKEKLLQMKQEHKSGLIDSEQLFAADDVINLIAHKLLKGDLEETSSTKTLEKNYEEASKRADELAEILNRSIDNFTKARSSIEIEAKQTAGKLKDASEKALQGVQRLEKMANLEKLERINKTLREVSDSLEKLAMIDERGLLDKILTALMK